LKTPGGILSKSMMVLLGVLLLFAGCGYRFMPGGENVDKSIQKVYVDVFENKTSEPGIENDFRNAFINQFIKGGRFTMADRQDEADAVFKGSIDNLFTSHLSYQSNTVAAEERMDAALNVSFSERATKKIVWANRSFTARQDYRVDTSNLSTTQASRKTAITKLTQDMAERVYILMMSGF
jgi:hypothetical protein